MIENRTSQQPVSILHSVLSFFVPGLGQFVARQRARGISILATFLILGWLSIWTIAQRARFPDLELSRQLFILIFLQTLALLVFLTASRYLMARFLIKETSSQTVLGIGLGLVYVIALLLVQEDLLTTAGSAEELKTIYTGTAIFAAASLAAFYLWQVADAGKAGAQPEEHPPISGGIALACLVIFSLGWNITGIDLSKAISEYQDTQIILRRIVWPWQAAFEYETVAVETEAKVQAPCPPGATGPAVQEPVPGEAWISVTPTCGEISRRDLATGSLQLGTELTITGGGFTPGATVEILWKNPIGNPFKPRGVGETEITINENGGFETKLNIPEVVIPSTAVGDQIHTLIVRQESGEVFTGKLSREIKLALEGILETIMIGLMATFFGVVFAFPFSFIAARNLMVPISAPLSRVVGGLVALIPAIWLAARGTGRVALTLGGLEEAPIQIALVGFVLIVGVGSLGSRLGASAFDLVAKRLSEIVGQVLTGLGLGIIGGGAGYYLGLGFSRGVVAIPVGAEVAALSEPRYKLGGAILFGLIGLVYGFLNAHKEFSIGMVIYTISRTFMNIVRSIEPLIWAIVGSIWVGLGPFAGTIALTLHTIAALGKLYSESIESIDHGPIEALQATGASRLQTVVYAVIPQVMPPFISFTIYRWDINVRMSTVIGLVGGGGIGFILIQWIRQFQYDAAGLAVWLITITVATLDYVSSNIRERFV